MHQPPDPQPPTHPGRDLFLLMAAVIGPPIISVLYLFVSGEINRASPVEGFARASRDMRMYWTYAVVLLAFVVVGTWRASRTATRLLFALLAFGVSVVAMFVAFFSQMAP